MDIEQLLRNEMQVQDEGFTSQVISSLPLKKKSMAAFRFLYLALPAVVLIYVLAFWLQPAKDYNFGNLSITYFNIIALSIILLIVFLDNVSEFSIDIWC